MVLGAFGLAFNILVSYNNVRTARRKPRILTSSINPNNARFATYPLLFLLPFLFTVLVQVAWPSHPRYNNPSSFISPPSTTSSVRGSAVRTSRRADDLSTCHQHAVSRQGLDLGQELPWCV